MATINYNFKKGTDLPSWHWLSPFPSGPSYQGSSSAYDGVRFIYWVIQYSTTAGVGTAGTTQLWRFDTWNNGWQYIAQTPTGGNGGIDVEYDSNRNALYVIIGNAGTVWYTFNLNTTTITIANQACAAWAFTTMTLVLPAAASYGASLTMPDATAVPSSNDSGTITTGASTTVLTDSSTTPGSFGQGLVGLQARFTSGALNGQRRTVTAVSGPNTLTVNAFGSAPSVGDTYVVELPTGTATTGGSTTVLTDSAAGWTANQYANQDVIMTSGAANGQRRRIASNTTTALTLSAAVTGNARTGAFSNAPAIGDTYQIVPSNDFLYYQPGNGSTALYRIDVVQTTGAAWSASMAAAPGGIGPGSNTFYPAAYAPFSILALRGASTASVYFYNMGLNTWSTLATFAGSETFSTGAAAAMIPGKRKLFIQKEAQSRCYAMDLVTGILEPAGYMPYASPSGYDGKRARFVKSIDGVYWMYLLRAGGQEFYRVPLEWL